MTPIITLTSDFGVQSQGIGNMEGVIAAIAPDARVIHLMHGLPDFDITSGARTLETIQYMPIGYHVCVVDPGVGTKRRGLIIKVKRGDYLIGPDNGVLIPASNALGGIEQVVSITNPKFMRQPVSPLFHGRDVFCPAAAHLANGTLMSEFGPILNVNELVPAPYKEAAFIKGIIHAKVIRINKYGSLHLNILNTVWDELKARSGQSVTLKFGRQTILATATTTFGAVPAGEPVIVKDDYGRVEVAVNQGNFAKKYKIKVGDKCLIKK